MTGKKFKVVFKSKTNSYELWFTDHKDEWVESIIYHTFTTDGKVIESQYDGSAMINENILWEINKMVNLGYKFLGIGKA